jgi:hypothetical protein
VIKCFSVGGDRWWIAFSGQLICACAQSFTLGREIFLLDVRKMMCFFRGGILGIPPFLAASWFGSDSVSTVTAIAVFGNQASKIID